MAEGDVAACPQVFVVDSQASYMSVPSERKRRWARSAQQLFLLLVGLSLLGLVVEGCFIYNLYKRTEEFSNPLCKNLSNPQTSAQEGDTVMNKLVSKVSNEILTAAPTQRPFAQLIGSSHHVGENHVVLWENKDGQSVSYHLDYSDGRLLVEKMGYYYIYSKLTINAVPECVLIQHKVMRKTDAYDHPIELMRSKSSRCRPTRRSSTKGPEEEDLWNSFLAGIFYLQSGDKVYVNLEDINKMRPGPTDNLMGAFMIYSGEMLQ